jgi:hypothetical protein
MAIRLGIEAVGSEVLQDGCITESKIRAGAIVTDHLEASAIDSAQIAAGAIDLAHMSVNSIDSDQYVDGSIDTAHFAAGSVDAAAMGADSVGDSELIDDVVSNAHLVPAALKSYKFTYSFAVQGGAAGALTLTAANGQLPDNFVIKSVTLHTKAAAVSGGASTIAIGITGNTDAFIAATAYTDNKFDVVDQCTALTNELPLITTAAADVIFTIADADLSAGIHEIWVTGFEGL